MTNPPNFTGENATCFTNALKLASRIASHFLPKEWADARLEFANRRSRTEILCTENKVYGAGL